MYEQILRIFAAVGFIVFLALMGVVISALIRWLKIRRIAKRGVRLKEYTNSDIESVLSVVKSQKDYSEKMAKLPQYKTNKYSVNSALTDEQMSGYYQGRAEANWSVIQHIQALKEQ